MTQVTITTDSGVVALQAPYNPDLPARAKDLGGRFRPGDKAWTFDPRDEQRVRDLARDLFGTDGADDDRPTVTVRVPLAGFDGWGSTVTLAGREIVRRPGRDM